MINVLKKKKRLLNTWFLSYLFIFTISIILSITIVVLANDITKKSIVQSTQFSLDKTKAHMSTNIETSIKLINQTYVNADIKSLLNSSKDDRSKKAMDYYNSMMVLVNYHSVHNHLYESLIYFNDYNKILSSLNGALSPELYYELKFKDSDLSFDDYYKFITDKYRYEIGSIMVEGKQKLFFSQTLPHQNAKNIKANVILLFNDYMMKEIVNSGKEISQGLIAIKKDNKIIYTTNDELLPSLTALEENSFLDKDYQFVEIDNQKYIVTETKANLADYSYLIVIPKEVFYTKYNLLMWIIIAIILISIVLSIIASRAFAKYQYKPVLDIMKTLKTESLNIASDEYSYINKSIKDSFKKVENLESTFEYYRPLIKTTFLKRLIRGETEISEKLNKDMISNGIVFDKKQFYVICIYIEDYDKTLIPSIYDTHYAKPEAVTDVLLTDIFKDIDIIQNRYSVTIDNTIVYIVNHDIKDTRSYVESLIDEAQNVVNEKYGIDFSTGISCLHHVGASAINEAWQEASYSLDYRSILGKNSILFYDDIKDKKRYYNSFSIATREKFINYINMGDYNKSKKLLDGIIRENYKESMAIETLVCLTNDIISAIVSVFSNEDGCAFLNNVKPNLTVLKARKAGKYIPDVISKILYKACEYKKNSLENAQYQNLSNKVKDYIADNYNNINLNISLLGDVFNLTPTYLSKIFKENTNTYLLDYINHIRIDASKNLLKTSSQSLTDIAKQCGFTNVNSYIRVFKKLEGITPGCYRKINIKNCS